MTLTVEGFDESVVRRLSGSVEAWRDHVGTDPQIEVGRYEITVITPRHDVSF
jgi:hypothetical protein